MADTAPWEDFAAVSSPARADTPPWEEFKASAQQPGEPVSVDIGLDLDKSEPASLRDTVIDAARRLGSGFASGAQDLGAGLVGGFAHLGNTVGAPGQLVVDAIRSQPGGTTHRQAAETIDADVRRLAHDPQSLNVTAGRYAPELAATAGALGKGASLAAEGARTVLPQAAQRFAPLLGDVSINAGYEGTKAALAGEDPNQGMKLGGFGAGVGHAIGGFLSHGVTPMLNAAQRKLAQAGVRLTPGQMGGKVGAAAEDLWASLPGTGIDAARRRAMGSYSTAEVNDILKPIGAATKKVGEDAVAHAKQIVSTGYEGVKPFVFVPQRQGFQALSQAGGDLQGIATLDAQQAAQVERYVAQRVAPHLTKGDVDGAVWKSIDGELSDLAFRNRTSSNPQDAPLGDAYAAVRARLQEALQGKVAGAVADIRKLDAARSRLYVLEDAANKATGKLGAFNPTQVSQAAIRAGKEAGELNRAGRELLTDKRPLSNTITRLGIPGAGSAIGTLTSVAGASAPVSAAVGAAVPLAAGASTNLINNPAMVRFILHGLPMNPRVSRNVSDRLATMPPQRQAQMIERMMGADANFAQAVAQLARLYNVQQQGQ